MKIDIVVNKSLLSTHVNPDETLLEVLRKKGYTSVKQGCDTSNCGLCTVWLDGTPILSCSYLAVRAEGKEVTTLEGIKEEAQKFGAFLSEEGGEQCGFCSPGLIMNVVYLKKNFTNPSEDEINTFLAGNLCRCTGYSSQMRAIKKYCECDYDNI